MSELCEIVLNCMYYKSIYLLEKLLKSRYFDYLLTQA